MKLTRGGSNDLAKVRVYMDGMCPVCQRSRRSLERLDWLKRLRFIDVHDREQCELDLPEVTYAQMLTRMFVKHPNGKYLSGFRAVRSLMPKLPLLWIFMPMVWLPCASWLGGKFYDFVARNRFKYAKCDDDFCSMHLKLVSGTELDEETIKKVIQLHQAHKTS